MSGEEIICGCGDHLEGCDYPVVGARCPTCAMLDRDEIEWLQKQCEMLTKERDEARAEVERLTVICEEAGMQVGLLEREVERLTKERDAMRSLYQETMDRLGQACSDVQKYKAKHHWYRTAFSEMAERVASEERSWPEEEKSNDA